MTFPYNLSVDAQKAIDAGLDAFNGTVGTFDELLVTSIKNLKGELPAGYEWSDVAIVLWIYILSKSVELGNADTST